MMHTKNFLKRGVVLGVAIVAICALSVPVAFAAPVLGGTLNPLLVPKYVDPLVIPPVMPRSSVQPPVGGTSGVPDAHYNIAVRQFQQQILPSADINGNPLGPTTVWSYGRAEDPVPAVAPADGTTFNYPAFTFETEATSPYGSGTGVNVRWINDLVDGSGNYLPHLLWVDQTLHWANPPKDCIQGSPRTDCRGKSGAPYDGPVPIVTHVHGAHVDPHSDGYPEAWWLPAANNIPLGYAREGSLFDEAVMTNNVPGSAYFTYRNDQPATTLWYHDHTLGMTRNNVYAGPAGFWMVRDTEDTGAVDNPVGLPGRAPVLADTLPELNVPGNSVRNSIREIPIAIQDRSFDIDAAGNTSLFYPRDRAFFEGLPSNTALGIPFIGDPPTARPSDISPIWNPEAFFNTMVVNGRTWPALEVAPALYRLRLLNGCNSRFLNLALFEVVSQVKKKKVIEKLVRELPFYQIGAEQGFLPQVVMIQTGFATPFPADGTGTLPTKSNQMVRAANSSQALLMGLAERADVIVDFRGLADGTRIRMINTAPDAPFGGFPDVPADPATTGQVMEFVVRTALMNGGSPIQGNTTDPFLSDGTTPNTGFAATNPWNLVLPAEAALGAPGVTRQVSLNEEESSLVCVNISPQGVITYIDLGGVPFDPLNPNNACALAGGVPFAPKAALLGQVLQTAAGPVGFPLMWTDAGGLTPVTISVPRVTGTSVDVTVTENPVIANGVPPTEDWQIYNFTVDGHPIHLHLVRFQVISRTLFDGVTPGVFGSQQPWETGYKDTVIAYPGEITTVRAKFDVEGLFVWHCHIVEHEDNEMMRPYVVSATP